MNVTLKPISHPAMGGISLNETPFTIGRGMEPFNSYKDEAVSRLSRRQARIFQDNGEVYIIDLGSLNGTQVNGQTVEEDVLRLLNGDQVSLAGDFLFRLVIEVDGDDEVAFVTEPPPRLTLVPVDAGSDIEPILVSRFPFLITRSYPLFGQYMEHSMEDVCKISRPHAIIGQKNNEIYIEDLGSENGTYMAGEQLGAGQTVVADGATIAFGGDRFTYKVLLEQSEQTRYDAACALAGDSIESLDDDADESRTMVNSTKSYLDMICTENSDKSDADPDSIQLQASAQERAKKPVSGQQERAEPHAVPRQAPVKVPGRNYQIMGTWIGVYALAYIMMVSVHFQGSEKQTIKNNLDNNIASSNYQSQHHPAPEAWRIGERDKAVDSL